MDAYYAHSGKDPLQRDWQGLAEHLRQVAGRAQTLAGRLLRDLEM